MLAAFTVACWVGLLAPETDPAPDGEPATPVVETEDDDDAADDDDTVREVRVPTQRVDGMTSSARTIPRRAIDNTPKRSAEDILRLVPGLHIVQHGSQGKGYQFYLRGFDAVHGSDVETLVDDIPINEPSNIHAHGYLDLAFIIPEVVDHVDATKGSLRLSQGNFGTAGSIHYRLGVRERGTRTSYEYGSTNRHRVATVYAPRGRSEDTFVAVEALHDDGYGENRQIQRISSIGSARLWSDHGTTLGALATVYGARFGLPGVVRIDDINRGDVGLYDAYLDDTSGESSRAMLALRARSEHRRVDTKMTAYTGVRRLWLDENFTGDLLFAEQGDRHEQTQAAVTMGVDGEVVIKAHDRVQVPLLAHWRGDFIDQQIDQTLPNGARWDTAQDLGIQQHDYGVGAGVRTAPTHWVQLEGGARLDAFTTRVGDRKQQREFAGTVLAVSPRVMTRFRPGERWQLFAGYGRGFRSPEARSFTLPQEVPSDVDLDRFSGGRPRMTLSDNAEVGARFSPSPLFDIGSSLFGTWIGRESIFDHVSGFNVERSGTQRLGVEGDVQIHAASWLDLGADVTYAHARFRDSGNPIPGAPPLVVSTQATLAHPKGFRGGLRWFLLGPRPLSYGATAGVATVLDVSVGYRYEWFQFDLAVDNVLGLRWREGEYHFASHWDPDRPRSQLPTVHAIAGNPLVARGAVTFWF